MAGQVTQSSVSRDIAALRLVKVDGVYRRAPARRSRARDPDELRIAEGVLTAEPAGDALVVVHTPPGEANRVGVALDRLAWPEIVGTIAGDDTIFLAVSNQARAAAGGEAAPGDRGSSAIAAGGKTPAGSLTRPAFAFPAA